MNSYHLIEDIKSKTVAQTKTAAMYYKTEPFFTDVNEYVHTNNWEILCAIDVLTSRGFSVDLIDRNNNNWEPDKEYDLFIGLGVGNSGKNFVRYANLSKAKQKILLAMGPQPDMTNILVEKRYNDFNKRHNMNSPTMRTTEVTGKKFLDIIDIISGILLMGEKNTNSHNSYNQYNKQIYNIYPGVNPLVRFNIDWLKSRNRKSFLCFVGNGMICKGVDIVVESFLMNEDVNLHICGPSEQSFFEAYGQKIQNSKNIKYHGFIKTGSDKFNELAAECSFVISHSASEGCATAIATVMKAGLVPIINPWSSIHIDNCGLVMSDDFSCNFIDEVTKQVKNALLLTNSQYIEMVNNTLEKSMIFCQESFRKSYSNAIDEIVSNM